MSCSRFRSALVKWGPSDWNIPDENTRARRSLPQKPAELHSTFLAWDVSSVLSLPEWWERNQRCLIVSGTCCRPFHSFLEETLVVLVLRSGVCGGGSSNSSSTTGTGFGMRRGFSWGKSGLSPCSLWTALTKERYLQMMTVKYRGLLEKKITSTWS